MKADNRKYKLENQRFGRLKVLEYLGGPGLMYRVLCDCGEVKNIRGGDLRDGSSKSCGCLNREKIIARLTTHGLSNTPEYKAWQGMISRCTDSNNPAYESYGDRGIGVCESWMVFENFYADMGPRNYLFSI